MIMISLTIVTRIAFMVLFLSATASVSVHFLCVEKSSLNMLLNVLFCVACTKKALKGFGEGE